VKHKQKAEGGRSQATFCAAVFASVIPKKNLTPAAERFDRAVLILAVSILADHRRRVPGHPVY
jgi:hypothetical protein